MDSARRGALDQAYKHGNNADRNVFSLIGGFDSVFCHQNIETCGAPQCGTPGDIEKLATVGLCKLPITLRNVGDIGWRAARFENAIFVVERDRKTGAVAEHAFDLAADPLQLHPLGTGADAPAWVRDARARLRKHLRELSDPFSDWLAA